MWPELYNGPWFKETCIKVCWFKKKIGLLQMQKLHYKLRYLVILLHMIKSFFLVYSHKNVLQDILQYLCIPEFIYFILYLWSGQARLDGAFCEYTEEDKMNFLKRAHARGITNIEMESLCFAAMCHRAGVKSTTCYMVHSPIK